MVFKRVGKPLHLVGSDDGSSPAGADIAATVQDVLTSFLDLQALPVDVCQEPPSWTAIVGIVGRWSGIVVVQGTQCAASRCASRMFAKPEGSLEPDDVADTWGEVANLFAGATICDAIGPLDLTTPTVVRGREYAVQFSHSGEVARASFEIDGGGSLFVAIYETSRVD